MAIGAGFRIICEVRPPLRIGECIDANADCNADNYPKQDALYRASFHLRFPFLIIKRCIRLARSWVNLAELVCLFCKTSISGAPREPDGGFTPTTAAKVGATSMVRI